MSKSGHTTCKNSVVSEKLQTPAAPPGRRPVHVIRSADLVYVNCIPCEHTTEITEGGKWSWATAASIVCKGAVRN